MLNEQGLAFRTSRAAVMRAALRGRLARLDKGGLFAVAIYLGALALINAAVPPALKLF